MSYYFTKTLVGASFEEAIDRTKKALKEEGFGVIAEIDFQKTLKEKLNVDFRKYMVLEACNPPYALKSLTADDKIGTMLPCNLVVQKNGDEVEVSSINPVVAMAEVDNAEMKSIALEISEKLERVVASL
ncbi:MAG: hypothetical protein IEMM0006_1865 [bacterium]|nr:MAG: hypothetical protein IEMM0006_1865 [bacterium]